MQHNRPTVVDDTSVFVQVVHLCNIMPFQRLCVTSCNIAVSNLKKIHLRRGTCNYVPLPLATPLRDALLRVRDAAPWLTNYSATLTAPVHHRHTQKRLARSTHSRDKRLGCRRRSVSRSTCWKQRRTLSVINLRRSKLTARATIDVHIVPCMAKEQRKRNRHIRLFQVDTTLLIKLNKLG